MKLRNAKFKLHFGQFIDSNTMPPQYEIVESIDVECDCGEQWTAKHSDFERKGSVTPQPFGAFFLQCRKCWRSIAFIPDDDVRDGIEFGEPQPEPKT